jgi:hypothetical protein
MAKELAPYTLRDFSKGRVSKDVVSNFLTPENSVSNSINVNFDTEIGSAKVRPGTVQLGDTVSDGDTPTGLAPFIGPSGTPDYLLAVYSNGSDASLYYYNNADGTWNLSTTLDGTLDPTAKNRFATLGGSSFITNTVDGMQDSDDADTWGTDNSIPTYKPGLVFRYAARLLASGDSTFPDRVFFSSIIDPNSSPFLTWNVDPTTGDWIDINPDDGGYVTGFSETSTFVLVFKNTGMYRMDTISKAVDPANIFNVGAVSQEAIVLCQGVTYYFSGVDIRRTNGGYPEQISRLGVQDFIDAIPLDNWTLVCSGTDQLNVYFFIGDVTLKQNTNDERAYTNVVLKFSPRDETWSVHSYAQTYKFFASFITNVTAL